MFNVLNTPLENPLYRRRNRGLERLSNLPKITQTESVRIGILTFLNSDLTPLPTSLHCFHVGKCMADLTRGYTGLESEVYRGR